MRMLRRLAIGLAVAVALLFAAGRPIAWSEAALIMWDLAAGGGPSWWQDAAVVDAPRALGRP